MGIKEMLSITLEEALKEIKHAKSIDDDFNIFAGIIISEKAIDKVVQELEKLQKENENLKSYLSKQGLVNDYIRFAKKVN